MLRWLIEQKCLDGSITEPVRGLDGSTDTAFTINGVTDAGRKCLSDSPTALYQELVTQSVDVAWEKVEWVMRKRDLLDDCLSEYSRSKPYSIVPDSDGKNKLHITKDPPVRLSIILGEMVYQFRSALDHLFFDLVQSNHGKGVLRDGWKRNCQFPLNTKPPDGVTPPVSRSGFNKFTRDALTDEAFTFVEGVQPYYPARDASRLLLRLTKLSNIDKHRRLNTTVLMVTRTQEAVTAEGGTSTAIAPWLKSGATIDPLMWHPFDVADAATVTDEFKEHLFFDEPEIGPPNTTPINEIVYKFPSFMLDFIIPNFRKLIENL